MFLSIFNGIIFRIYSLGVLFLFLFISLSDSTNSHPNKFYSKSTLQDGVHEINLFFNGIRVKETTAGPKEGSPSGIVARQLSNGRQVVNLIYNGVPPYLQEEEGDAFEDDDKSLVGTDEEGLKLRECLVEKSKEEVKKFVADFDHNAENLRRSSQELSDSSTALNSTYISLENGAIPGGVSDHIFAITQFKSLKHKCFNLNRKIRKLSKFEQRQRLKMQQNDTSHLNNRNRRGIRELLILPGTKWCGNGRLAKTYNDIDGYMKADHCCRTHDLCPSSIPRFSRKFGLYNYRLTTISHCSCDKRNKRAVTDLLSVPNTKWCGRGYRAKSYDQLGGLYGADSCCRQHDLHCPFFIQSFERKYGYFHFGLSTISHCSCDRRFKTCLKQIGTGAADVVGNVFFRLVKASCFDFKKRKVCKKRGFWSCLKWGYEKQAVIRNPISWNA